MNFLIMMFIHQTLGTCKRISLIDYLMGFYFVDVRSSILNNEKHATYKVSVDTIYVADLTQWLHQCAT